MTHIIRFTTTEAIMLCRALADENFANEIDKAKANRMKDDILRVVGVDLRHMECGGNEQV